MVHRIPDFPILTRRKTLPQLVIKEHGGLEDVAYNGGDVGVGGVETHVSGGLVEGAAAEKE